MNECTLIIIKPDAFERHLVGFILSKFDDPGFEILGIRKVKFNEREAAELYEEHRGKPFWDRLIKFTSSGPCLVVILSGENVVNECRKRIKDIRDNYMIQRDVDKGATERNLVHGSDSQQSAWVEMGKLVGMNVT